MIDGQYDSDMSSVHLVHVGKCAGESVLRGLHDAGVECVEHHCYQADVDILRVLHHNPKAKLLVLLRDPVKRYVSSFEWEFFEKVLRRGTGYQLPTNQLWRDMFLTFRNANELAEALTSPDPDRKTLAYAIFHRSKLHIHMSLSWYLGARTIRSLNSGNILPVRVENIDEDFNKALKKLNAKPRDTPLPRFKSDYRSQLPEAVVCKSLTDQARLNLQNAYSDDYLALEALKGVGIEEASIYL